MYEVEFPKTCSVVKAYYLQYKFLIPLYPWEAWTPDLWTNVASAISKVLVYHRFSPDCYKDHHLWRESRMGIEALRFADFLTRDRGFRNSIQRFNAQASTLKYGKWLEPFDTGMSPDFPNHIAQLGQWIYNATKFLKDTGYLLVYGDLLKTMRPYWLPPAEWAIRRDIAKGIIKFIENFYDYNKKYPTLRAIAEFWRVPRYTLIKAGFTMEVIRDMYRHYKRTNEIKIIKPTKEYKIPSEEEQKQIAERIVKRIYGKPFS